jgi:hypothetical protein
MSQTAGVECQHFGLCGVNLRDSPHQALYATPHTCATELRRSIEKAHRSFKMRRIAAKELAA